MKIYLVVGVSWEDHVIYSIFTNREDAQHLADNLKTWAWENARTEIDYWEQVRKDREGAGRDTKEDDILIAALRRGSERDKNWWTRRHSYLTIKIEEFTINEQRLTREEYEAQYGDTYYI